MLINNTKLAFQFFKEEFSSSHQKLLRWVQGLLLLFITTLSLSSDNIQTYLTQNLNGLLGADAVLSQKQRLSDPQFDKLSSFANKMVVTQQVDAVLSFDNNWQQVQLKAVGNDYPLQGELVISDQLSSQSYPSPNGPIAGEIWLDARAFSSLAITINDKLTIANKSFTVTKVLQHEPDRLMEGHSVAMRAMINEKDLNKLNISTDLIQFRYLLSATKKQISDFDKWQKIHLPAAQLLHKGGSHPLALFWKRTENFLGLASIILFFMAAIAIDQISKVQIKKEQFFSAICLSVGSNKQTAIQVSVIKWLFSVVSLIIPIGFLSLLFHYQIIQFLTPTFSQLSWSWSLTSLIKPIIASTIIFAVFHLPVWISLLNSSVAKQLNDEGVLTSNWLSKVCSAIVLLIVAYLYSDNGLLTFMMLTAFSLTVILMLVASWSALTLGEKLTQGFSGLFPFALFMMKQRLLSKSTQILGVGLCAFLLLFTLMLLKDIGGTMSAYQRQHDGNLFISRASSDQTKYIEQWAKDNKINIRQIKPYMDAKLTQINDQAIDVFASNPSESLATFKKAIRIHWTAEVPNNNELVDGRWWNKNTNNWQQVSVEQEVMTDIGLSIGDSLTFYINQKPYTFDIVASHEIKPGSGSITFWVQMPPAALPHIQTATYNMASLELNDKQWPLLGSLYQQFPTLRMISLKELTSLFDQTLEIITKVVSGFTAFILLLSTVVIIASIKSLETKEKRKNSIVMSFGFTRKTCLKLNVIEWFVTAAITAFGAIFGTYIAGELIYKSQFNLPYSPDFVWLTTTLLIIVGVITSIGIYFSRVSLTNSIRKLLASK